MKILVTGYAGFIGSNLTRMLLEDKKNKILGLDCFTYAARPEWVWRAVPNLSDHFTEANIDLRDYAKVEAVIKEFKPDRVFHLAAESHVCNSITGPHAFATTNFMGTFNLIEALRKNNFKGTMVHVSTDEVFGELDLEEAPFHEDRFIQPRSPYSASKAASDLIALSYFHTYNMDIRVTRCTNNYGPNQHEEKLIPKTIISWLKGEEMTIYGNGKNRRDWIFVDDHCRALELVMNRGVPGEIYCIGSTVELENRQVLEEILIAMTDIGLKPNFKIKYTNDRPTDDKRYAVDTSKIEGLGFTPMQSQGYLNYQLRKTVQWYADQIADEPCGIVE